MGLGPFKFLGNRKTKSLSLQPGGLPTRPRVAVHFLHGRKGTPLPLPAGHRFPEATFSDGGVCLPRPWKVTHLRHQLSPAHCRWFLSRLSDPSGLQDGASAVFLFKTSGLWRDLPTFFWPGCCDTKATCVTFQDDNLMLPGERWARWLTMYHFSGKTAAMELVRMCTFRTKYRVTGISGRGKRKVSQTLSLSKLDMAPNLTPP